MINIGVINRLKISRESEHGLYLEDKEHNEVLLPVRYVTEDMNIGDMIDVFVYLDSEDRKVATTERPIALLEEFGYFEVVDKTNFGVFVDWGLIKDLFVPLAFMKRDLKIGDKVILKVLLDQKTGRLIGSSKVQRYLRSKTSHLKKNNKLELLIIARTPLGYKVIANNLYEGMIYHNEIFQDIAIGEKVTGYLKKIREDGKCDFSLKPIGEDGNDVQNIIDRLNTSEGFAPYNYKSDPEDIKREFSLSKKAFKKALTQLQNDNKIEIFSQGIKLI